MPSASSKSSTSWVAIKQGRQRTAYDKRDVGGAERFGEEPEIRGGGAVMGGGDELLAEVDQSADEEEDAVEGGGHGWGGPRWIGVGGCGRGVGGGVRHERT